MAGVVHAIASFIAIVAGLASAYCWFRSARAEVLVSPDETDFVMKRAKPDGTEIDLTETAYLQGVWNARAASWACAAAIAAAVDFVA